MRPSKQLARINKSTQAALRKFEKRAFTIANPVTATRYLQDREISDITINLLNCWSNFCRCFFVSCMLGTRSSKYKTYYVSAHPVASVNDAIGLAFQITRPTVTPNSSGVWPRRLEPTWHDPTEVSHLLKFYCLISQSVFDNAISSGARFPIHLPTFRNFYAHRNEQTLSSASQFGPTYGVSAIRRPTEILLAASPQGGTTVLGEWINEMRFIVEFCCE